jgi:tetratricopeptide (TPR) repeat protein
MKHFITTTILVFLLFASVMFASDKNATEKIILEGIEIAQKAYIYYNRDMFEQSAKLFESVLQNESSNKTALYHLTFVEYKLLEMGLVKGNEDLFDKYYDKAVKDAKEIASDKLLSSEGKTLLAGIYMMKIANSPLSAVTLSGTIHELLDEAQILQPRSPRSYIIRGVMKFNTPSMFGGSKEDAMKNFSKAVSLFEREENIDSLSPNWGYLESLAWLGRANTALENYETALYAYNKALNVEPNFMWVKNNLLPNLKKKMSEK